MDLTDESKRIYEVSMEINRLDENCTLFLDFGYLNSIQCNCTQMIYGPQMELQKLCANCEEILNERICVHNWMVRLLK